MRDEELRRIGEEYWELTLRHSPTHASLLGRHDLDAELEDLRRTTEDDLIDALEDLARRAEALDPGRLDLEDRVSREVLLFEATTTAAELRSRTAEFAVDPFLGIQVVYPQLAGQLPIARPEHADAAVGRWSKMGRLFDQAIARLRDGLARNRTPPRVASEKVIAQIDAYLASTVETDPFVNLRVPPSFDPSAAAAWRERLVAVVRDVVRPAYARYRHVVATEILPRARPPEHSGVVWLPDGEEIYARAIHQHTSRQDPPETIHRTGLDVTAGLEDEYRRLGAQVLGTGDLAEIYRRLREDPELRFTAPAEILASARAALERAQAAIPDWFGRLPGAPCVVAQMPPMGADDAPLAFYLTPAPDGSRPGTYFVNTTAPTTRTRYEAEALAFHESIPGHHLQLAIAQELEDLPEFRRHATISVFTEGWGLYTERLADEMGLYSSDLSRMGMLSFDSWRAGRLVVDTGIHALGWSRQQAIAYLVANSPQAENNVVNEVERYIALPGQALAYMTGRLAILAARDRARRTRGDRFDIRAFHDVVLGHGAIPLATLDRLVGEWASVERDDPVPAPPQGSGGDGGEGGI